MAMDTGAQWRESCIPAGFLQVFLHWKVTHIEPSEEILDGLFCDVIGQVSQECRVWRGFGEAASVDVGLAGSAWGRGKDGAVDRRRPVNVVVIAVPHGGDCREIRDVGTAAPGWSQLELARAAGASKSSHIPPTGRQREEAGVIQSHLEATAGSTGKSMEKVP